MTKFVAFLSALGFNDPRQTARKDVIELVVYNTLTEVRRRLRTSHIKFLSIGSERTRSSIVEEYYVVQDRIIVGRMRVESYSAHSVVQLINLENP